MTHPLDAQVSALMRDVAQRIVMPRFRTLDAAQIEEKAPDELVTVADRESEAALGEALLGFLPGCRVIGEEACAADESLIGTIDRGQVWIVDPIDGTHNFASGEPPFGIMVALAEDGATQAAWILDPLTGRLCHAARGRGAFINGTAVQARATGADLPVAGLSTRYLPAQSRDEVEARAQGHFTCVPIPRCAAEQYPRLILGENDVALFWRTLAWDHAAGALLVEEAGGRVARFDGTPYRPGQDTKGLLAAASPELWERSARILLG